MVLVCHERSVCDCNSGYGESILIMVRFLSVTYGRPPLIPLSHVSFEASPYLPFSNVPSGITISSLAYFDAMM